MNSLNNKNHMKNINPQSLDHLNMTPMQTTTSFFKYGDLHNNMYMNSTNKQISKPEYDPHATHNQPIQLEAPVAGREGGQSEL